MKFTFIAISVMTVIDSIINGILLRQIELEILTLMAYPISALEIGFIFPYFKARLLANWKNKKI